MKGFARGYQRGVGEPKPNEPCPCRRGKLARDCCWRHGKGWSRKPIALKISPPTGIRTAGCYAEDLEDCFGELTDEHVVAEQILGMTGERAVTVSGISWLPDGKPKKIGIGGLTADVSCDRHNSITNQFEDELKAFIEVLRELHLTPSSPQVTDSRFWLFSGPDIERALLKVMFTGIAAGWTQDGSAKVKIPKAPRELLEILFRNSDASALSGFHVIRRREDLPTPSPGVRLQPWFNLQQRKAVVGAGFDLYGFDFGISLVPLPERGTAQSPYDDAWRRPTRFEFREGSCRRVLGLSWPHGYDGDQRPIVLAPVCSRPGYGNARDRIKGNARDRGKGNAPDRVKGNALSSC